MHGFSYVFLSFLSGAVPYSVILGKLLLREDIREYGDGNPGAANVWRAGGPLFGLAAIMLDLLKAFLPVYYAMVYCDFPDNTLMAIAIAPVPAMLSLLFCISGGERPWLPPTESGWLYSV